MIEKQQKKIKEMVMPETVYRRAIWAIKDLPRIEEKITDLEQGYLPTTDFGRVASCARLSDNTSETALLLASLKASRDKIYEGIDFVPEKYRKGVFEKLVWDKPYPDDFHLNTWKKWQHVAIFAVARKMQLI